MISGTLSVHVTYFQLFLNENDIYNPKKLIANKNLCIINEYLNERK
jgi:hypothetical protein